MPDLFQTDLDLTRDRAHLIDAITLLQSLPAESVDQVVSDTAYESLEKHRVVGTTTRLKKRWFPIFPNERIPGWLLELYRIMKPKRHAYLFVDEETRDVVLPAARAAGFWFWKSIPYIKVRKTIGKPRDYDQLDEPAILQLLYGQLKSGTGYHWRATREFVMFLEKRTAKQVPLSKANGIPVWREKPTGTGRQLNENGWPDILFGIRDDRGYPTEKDPHVIRRLILNSTQPGEVVIDTFAGSGVVGTVARAEGRRFIIGDIAENARSCWRARGLLTEDTAQ